MATRPDTMRMKKGDAIDLARLDQVLDVDMRSWDRTVKKLVKEFRTKGLRLVIPKTTITSPSEAHRVTWTRLYEAQVKRLPRMDRAEEFHMARRYEFCKARVVDALAYAGYRPARCSELVRLPFADLPAPDRRRSRAAVEHLRRCTAELEALRNLYVERGLYMVHGPVRRYCGLGVDEADLVQEGNASLFQAIEGFDWRRDVRFKTYAIYWIQQAILKTLYNSSRTVRIPVWVQKAYRKIQRAREHEMHATGSYPTSNDLGDRLGLPANRVEDILGVRRYAVSLDASVAGDEGFTLGQVLPDENAPPVYDQIEDGNLHRQLEGVLAELPPRERDIIVRRYGLHGQKPETLAEIAEDMGITAERVRQLQKAGLERLQRPQRIARLRAFA